MHGPFFLLSRDNCRLHHVASASPEVYVDDRAAFQWQGQKKVTATFCRVDDNIVPFYTCAIDGSAGSPESVANLRRRVSTIYLVRIIVVVGA